MTRNLRNDASSISGIVDSLIAEIEDLESQVETLEARISTKNEIIEELVLKIREINDFNG